MHQEQVKIVASLLPNKYSFICLTVFKKSINLNFSEFPLAREVSTQKGFWTADSVAIQPPLEEVCV